MGGIIMERNELETLIRFAKNNGIINWPFEDVVNEYKTVKIHHEEPKFDLKTLQPLDKVLVRDINTDEWHLDLFSHINHYGEYACIGGFWAMVIPYNDETKSLLGKTDNCSDYYECW